MPGRSSVSKNRRNTTKVAVSPVKESKEAKSSQTFEASSILSYSDTDNAVNDDDKDESDDDDDNCDDDVSEISNEDDESFDSQTRDVEARRRQVEAHEAEKARIADEKRRRAEEEKAAKEAELRAKQAKASMKFANSPSVVSPRKRGRATKTLKMAKEHLLKLEDAEDYNSAKQTITNQLWSLQLSEIQAARDEIENINDARISQKDMELYDAYVQKKLHKKYSKYTYEELCDEYNFQVDERKRLIEEHANALQESSQLISYLLVRKGNKRQTSRPIQDLKIAYEEHITMRNKAVLGEVSLIESPVKTSSKKSRR